MSAEHLGPGAVIAGRYVIEALIGRGGMGAVYRARQEQLDRTVALKVLLPEHGANPGARARFEREARVASQLRHPHVVSIYDFGDDGGRLYLAMELLIGHTLRAIVDTHLPPPPLELTRTILAQVADALASAHAIELVHRDVKPDNVFLESRDGGDRVKVVDFGLAFIADRPRAGRMTAEGIATGTPEYMSPEQAAGDDVGPASDVYSLGVMLYEMLTGKTPFHGTALQLITQHAFSPPPAPARRDGGPIPRALEALCLSMLAKRASRRPSMRDVRAALCEDPTDEERGRGAGSRLPRAARAAVRPAEEQSPTGPAAQLAVVGALDGDLAIALAANRVDAFVVSDEQPIDGADAIWAPDASSEELSALRSRGLPVLTSLAAKEIEAITELLRAGVASALAVPVDPDQLAKKVWRAVESRRRQGT
ncbi:MAG: serine/threonine-protein kinase [Sandaracinaceae bacterium]